MTENRRAKQAIRTRMAATGEKYSDARRASPPPPADRDTVAGTDPSGDAIGWFTDQAYNAILLAEDEARMLGHRRVEPCHLLLAAARSGNVQRLLAQAAITAAAIHAEVVRRIGFGSELVVGRVARSGDGEAVLARAIAAAAERGISDPSTEHLLLGLAADERAAAVLYELGLANATALVDAAYRVLRPALDPDTAARRALVGRARSAPRPGPMPPVFERFTVEARNMVEDAAERARALQNAYVSPDHLLLALLGARDGVVASIGARHRRQFDSWAARVTDLLSVRPSRATGIFSDSARRMLAEGVLEVAHRRGDRALGTGHLFLAVIASPESTDIPPRESADLDRLAVEITDTLPGNEHT
jgi:ATP-dependent Clp protease ATP-binding subunit ClpA